MSVSKSPTVVALVAAGEAADALVAALRQLGPAARKEVLAGVLAEFEFGPPRGRRPPAEGE